MIQNADTNPQAGDLVNAGLLGGCVVLAILNALVWAPWVGAKISDPVTGIVTDSTYVERPNWLSRSIRAADHRGSRRLTVLLCFVEGVRHPWTPTPFVLGLKNARPGSWLEKVYAREVWRFQNSQNCLRAYETLLRHGIDPGPHPNPQVNLFVRATERVARPDPEPLIVPPASAPPPLKRNPQIRLFDSPAPLGTEEAGGSAAAADPEKLEGKPCSSPCAIRS